MSAIYLTAEEVAEATGLKYQARQVVWLREPLNLREWNLSFRQDGGNP